MLGPDEKTRQQIVGLSNLMTLLFLVFELAFQRSPTTFSAFFAQPSHG